MLHHADLSNYCVNAELKVLVIFPCAAVMKLKTEGRQALAMLQKESFDAVLLDLRCSELQAEKVVSEIKEIRPNLVGRVLVITGEVTDPETLEIIERNCLPHVSQSRMMDELWTRLRSLLGFSHSPADSSS